LFIEKLAVFQTANKFSAYVKQEPTFRPSEKWHWRLFIPQS